MTKKPDTLQGALDLLVLKTLAARGPLHGYGIALHVEAVSDDVLRMEEGSLYPALHRMEQAGWVRSSWRSTDNNRRAKFYGVTAAGVEASGRRRAQLARGRQCDSASAAVHVSPERLSPSTWAHGALAQGSPEHRRGVSREPSYVQAPARHCPPRAARPRARRGDAVTTSTCGRRHTSAKGSRQARRAGKLCAGSAAHSWRENGCTTCAC